jgi:hypothetical protein
MTMPQGFDIPREQIESGIDAEDARLKREDELDRAFQKFLLTRRDHREGLTARQQLWCAFEAGAQWALSQIK